MARKMFRTIEADVDAGTQDDRLYNKAFDRFRSSLRNSLLPFVRKETPILGAMQKRIRSPGLDAYFIWTANLGTHTFFMIFLPILIWFGNDEIGRNIAVLTASGVFWSGFVKDFLCLPRPLSPPVHRLTMSPSVALEYGFPSTHSTNSIQVALFFISVACEKFASASLARMISIIACTIYAASVVFGRVYCGMHSVTDCIGGAILAYILYWIQWTFREQMNYFLTNQSSYWVFLGIPLILMLVSLHPDPMERCPCFEDSVCFMGVLIGLLPGTWLCYGNDVCVKGLSSSNISMQLGLLGSLLLVLKLIIGVACLFVWRIVCKKLCYFILPPIYRVFNLPHRKFEIGARTYKTLRRESIHPVPSVLDFQSISNNMKDHDHVGIQSAIDLKEAQDQQLSYRGNGQTKHMPISTSAPEKEAFDPTSLLVLEDAPLRYDVDIVTKLIVYAGIGFIATFAVPIIFEFLSRVL